MGMTRETEVLRAWDGVVVDNREERQAKIPRKGGGVFPAAGGVALQEAGVYGRTSMI